MLEVINRNMIEKILLSVEDDELATINKQVKCSFQSVIQCRDFWRKRFTMKFGDRLGKLYFERCEGNMFYNFYDYYMYKSYGTCRFKLTTDNFHVVDIESTCQNLRNLFNENRSYHNNWFVRIYKRERMLRIFKKQPRYRDGDTFQINIYVFGSGKATVVGCKSPQEFKQYAQELKKHTVLKSIPISNFQHPR